MLLSMNWLREFVPFDGSAQELGDKLSMLGLQLEEIRRPFAGVTGIVVGHVVECARHPEADKLSLCRVDVGTELLDIVCGAPNVRAGQKVPVALVGTTLPDGTQIKKAKLRGAPSHGMICSERELELSEDHSGIMVLDNNVQIGAKLIDVLQLDSEVLDISVTPNRGDCLSVLGLAREVALGFDLPVTLPVFTVTENANNANNLIRIEIADSELCPLYQARILEGAKVGKSPDWLRFRLLAMGQRPISNLVDVTNYILLGLGQPLHAFDLDKISGGRIIVRPADEGEEFISLDGRKHALCSSDLTIRDQEKVVALAGVMGGLDSEIAAGSADILLECAIFRPGAIRRTARRLGISSEAAYRFERGVDQGLAAYALDAAAALMAQVSGASVLTGIPKAEPKPWKKPVIPFRPLRSDDLLGQALSREFCACTLEKLGCAVNTDDTENWEVMPPSHRRDLEREVDLIEEVARVYGVDCFAPVLPNVTKPLDRAGTPETEFQFWRQIRSWACGLGLNEVISYSFVGQKDLDRLGLPKINRIAIQNPLAADQDVLRTDLAPGLLAVMRNNLVQDNDGLRLFELAHVFHADPAKDTTVREPGRLGLLLYGDLHDSAWPHVAADAGYAELKGVVEHFLAFLRLENARFVLDNAPHGFLRPAVNIFSGNDHAGTLGRVLPEIADVYHASKDVWIAELDLTTLRRLHDAVRLRFSPLPVYPSAKRDITLAVPYTLPADMIVDAIRGMKMPLLEEVFLLDLYQPENDPMRRLTFRMVFRNSKRTLEDAEVDKLREDVAQYLPKTLPVHV